MYKAEYNPNTFFKTRAIAPHPFLLFPSHPCSISSPPIGHYERVRAYPFSVFCGASPLSHSCVVFSSPCKRQKRLEEEENDQPHVPDDKDPLYVAKRLLRECPDCFKGVLLPYMALDWLGINKEFNAAAQSNPLADPRIVARLNKGHVFLYAMPPALANDLRHYFDKVGVPTVLFPFTLSAMRGQAETIAMLLRCPLQPIPRVVLEAALFYACQHGHLKIVQLLLPRAKEPFASVIFSYGAACSKGHITVADALYKWEHFEASMPASGVDLTRFLVDAACMGHADGLARIIQYTDDRRFIISAIFEQLLDRGHREAVDVLIKTSAPLRPVPDPKWTAIATKLGIPMYALAAYGNLLTTISDRGAITEETVDLLNSVAPAYYYLVNVLMVASMYGRADAIGLFLRHPVAKDMKKDVRKILGIALSQGHVNVVEEIFDVINWPDTKRYIPYKILYAVMSEPNNSTHLVDHERGVYAVMVKAHFARILAIACRYGLCKILDLLLEFGFTQFKKPQQGNRVAIALHEALEGDRWYVVEHLLDSPIYRRSCEDPWIVRTVLAHYTPMPEQKRRFLEKYFPGFLKHATRKMASDISAFIRSDDRHIGETVTYIKNEVLPAILLYPSKLFDE
jgi:ankyrin repeat protein